MATENYLYQVNQIYFRIRISTIKEQIGHFYFRGPFFTSPLYPLWAKWAIIVLALKTILPFVQGLLWVHNSSIQKTRSAL